MKKLNLPLRVLIGLGILGGAIVLSLAAAVAAVVGVALSGVVLAVTAATQASRRESGGVEINPSGKERTILMLSPHDCKLLEGEVAQGSRA